MIFPIVTSTLKLWKQERIIAYKSTTRNVIFWTDLEGSSSNPIAKYTPPTDGKLYIDLTDYVRAHPTVTKFSFFETGGGVHLQTDVTVSVVGLINPASVIIPERPIGMEMMVIAPPARMLRSLTNGQLIWEARAAEGDNYSVEYTDSDNQPQMVVVTAPSYTVPKDAEILAVVEDEYSGRKYACFPHQCGVRYAMVRWVSFTGVTRCHTMEVVKGKTETKDAYSLLPVDNEYVEIKGREDGFTLHLNGLCAYDLWYYADMIHSSKIEVSLDGTTWDRVQVTKKSFTMPDGEGSDGEIEIQVNWKRYDAVAM